MAFKIFINTKEIPLYNYIKFLETENLRFFCNTQNSFIHLFISNKKLEKAKDLILNEMFKDNYEVRNRISAMHKIEKYKVKFRNVNTLIDCLVNYGYNAEIVKELESWGHKIKPNFDILKQLYKIKIKNQALITEIEALQVEISKSSSAEKMEIEEVLFNLEQGLEIKYKLDIKKLSLFEFLMLQKKLAKKIEKWHK